MNLVPRLKMFAILVVVFALAAGFMKFSAIKSTAYAREIASKPSACGSWNVIPGANPGLYNNGFSGVAAISTSDIWAVGSYHDDNPGISADKNWNGTARNTIASPSPAQAKMR